MVGLTTHGSTNTNQLQQINIPDELKGVELQRCNYFASRKRRRTNRFFYRC